MGFNKRKMDDARRQAAEQEAAAHRATEKQILEDADHLVAVWNERQAKRMPMLFSPTVGAAITAGYWFLRARCPACRTTGDVDLRKFDWHHGAAVMAENGKIVCRGYAVGRDPIRIDHDILSPAITQPGSSAAGSGW